MLFSYRAFLASVLVSFAICGSCPGQVTIAVTANMRPVLDTLKPFLEREILSSVVLVPGASGQLASQIIAGAPYDLFLSADTSTPNALARRGLTIGPVVLYVHGTLILWSTKTPGSADIIKALTAPAIRHVAIANPSVAPYGTAAMDVIRHYHLEEFLRGKLVYGESVTQVNRYILSGEADIGFTAQSAVAMIQSQSAGSWVAVDTASYRPIAQGMVMLKRAGQSPAAGRCFQLLMSDSAQAVYKRYGYHTTNRL